MKTLVVSGEMQAGSVLDSTSWRETETPERSRFFDLTL